MLASVSQVLQEIRSGQGIGLAAVGRKFPGRSGGQTNACTVYRWATNGCRAANGTRVKLETVRVGSRLLTSEPALERFVLRLSETSEQNHSARSPTAARRASSRADAELAAAGC